MSTEHDQKNHIEELESVLDDYTEWFMGFVRRVFYPAEAIEKVLNRPESFSLWMRQAIEEELFTPERLEGLKNLNNDLHQYAATLLSEVYQKKQPPAYSDFDKLATFFEEFLNLVRRLEKEYLLGESGVDVRTGLRSKDMFYKDIQRELDRLERQGKSFSLALVNIDHFDRVRRALNDSAISSVYKLVADMIRKSTRSFDDAYNMDEGMFVVALKQTKASGGLRALQRLKTSIGNSKQVFDTPEGKLALSVSSCITEPLPNDDIRSLLVNMKKDILAYPDQGGAIIEYVEISPLQRFIKKDG